MVKTTAIILEQNLSLPSVADDETEDEEEADEADEI
jgi:hypothetical protein